MYLDTSPNVKRILLQSDLPSDFGEHGFYANCQLSLLWCFILIATIRQQVHLPSIFIGKDSLSILGLISFASLSNKAFLIRIDVPGIWDVWTYV